MITPSEEVALEHLVQLANLFQSHIIGFEDGWENDWAEIAQYIHQLQRAIFQNIAAREHPDMFRELGKFFPED